MSLRNLPSVVWKCKDDSCGSTPRPRFGQAIVRHSRGTVLVHGGACLPNKSKQLQLFNDLFILKVNCHKSERMVWRQVVQYGDLPPAQYGHKLCRYQHYIYLIGGQDSIDASSSLPDVYQLNTVSFVWSLVNEGKSKAPCWLGSSANEVNSGVFVFGGQENTVAHSYLAFFDMVNHEWSYPPTCGPLPPSRCDHASTVVGSDIFIHGGCGGPQTYYADLFKLDTTTLTWEEIIAKGFRMTPRAGMTLTAHHSKDLYVFGGYNDILCPDGGPVIDPLMKYSFNKNEWKKISCLTDDSGVPDASYHHSAFIINNTLYIVFGVQLRGEVNFIRRAQLLNPSERNTYLLATQRSNYSYTPEDSVSIHSNRDFRTSIDSNIARYQSQLAAKESYDGGSALLVSSQQTVPKNQSDTNKPIRPYIEKLNNDSAMQSFLQHEVTESDDDDNNTELDNSRILSCQADTDQERRNSMNLQMNANQKNSMSNSENASSFSSPELLP